MQFDQLYQEIILDHYEHTKLHLRQPDRVYERYRMVSLADMSAGGEVAQRLLGAISPGPGTPTPGPAPNVRISSSRG
jgi:hypothetical protein